MLLSKHPEIKALIDRFHDDPDRAFFLMVFDDAQGISWPPQPGGRVRKL